jgi:hypothetical protein
MAVAQQGQGGRVAHTQLDLADVDLQTDGVRRDVAHRHRRQRNEAGCQRDRRSIHEPDLHGHRRRAIGARIGQAEPDPEVGERRADLLDVATGRALDDVHRGLELGEARRRRA